MDLLVQAHEVLAVAEQELRKIASAAVAAGDYDVVVELAQLARGVEALRRSCSTDPHSNERALDVDPSAGAQPSNPRDKPKPPLAKRREYPLFFKSGDILVKVGWSKRHKAEYEHRAPLSAVMALVDVLEKRATHTAQFSTENVFPLYDSKRNDIPGYQGYVALAWLLQIGAIRKEGRQGYQIGLRRPLRELVAEQWRSIPQR